MKREKILKLEEVIQYTFKNKNLIRQSLSHSSYVNEKNFDRIQCNERLEFLGDAVLELITSEYIYEFYPKMTEGEMTKLRASIVCEPTLAYCANEIGLGDFLFLGRGEELTGGRYRNSILSDALEAVIGAIYLDGGFTNAKEFILHFILSDIEHKKLFYDSKTILQEIIQSTDKGNIEYIIEKEVGPDHNKEFHVATYLSDVKYAVGIGKTKKAAEQEAAYKTILKLRQENVNVFKKH